MFLQQMMTYVRDYLLTILSQRFTIDVILSYVRHIFDLPMSFLRLGKPVKLPHVLVMPTQLLTH